MKICYDLKLLSQYRTQLMGVAMLLVMFVHTPIDRTKLPIALQWLQDYGYGGVDVFLLLSGLGMFFACQKESLLVFYKKRLLRILPYYLPVMLLYSLAWQLPMGHATLNEVFLRTFLVNYWVTGEGLD